MENIHSLNAFVVQVIKVEASPCWPDSGVKCGTADAKVLMILVHIQQQLSGKNTQI